MSINMSYDYIKTAPPFARAKAASKNLESLKAKLERWGSSSNLDSEIALCESLLDNYLLEAAGDAMKSLDDLQADLEELDDRQIAQLELKFSELRGSRNTGPPNGFAIKSFDEYQAIIQWAKNFTDDPEFLEWVKSQLKLRENWELTVSQFLSESSRPG